MASTTSIVGSVVVFLACLAFAGTGGYLLWSQEQALAGSEQVTGTVESSSGSVTSSSPSDCCCSAACWRSCPVSRCTVA